jgi:aminobenzoyl-glutamate utilization protein B
MDLRGSWWKIYMARDGLFSDVDVCLDWHPDVEILQICKALMVARFCRSLKVRLLLDPLNGRSVDGLTLFLTVNTLQEHVSQALDAPCYSIWW